MSIPKPVTVDRRDAIKLGAGAVAGLAAGLAKSAPAIGGRSRPNILILCTDQQHRDTIAADGCRYVTTPGQDRLAELGVTFRAGYSTNPICSPARSSIFTGRMPCETGVWANGQGIHESVPNIGQWLSEQAGYETIYTGKWHIPASQTAEIPGFRVPVIGLSGQGNLGDSSISLGCEGYLRNHDPDEPFCLVASFLQPHDICQWLRTNQANVDDLRYPEIASDLPPLPANFAINPDEPPEIAKRRSGNEPTKGGWSELHWRYYRWCYFRMIEQVDMEIARVVRALEESGQAENTLICMVSDHGEGLGHHQMVRKNFLFDEAANVPFQLAFPGHGRAGVVDLTTPVSHADIVPTICDYVGIDAPPHIRGKSLRPLLEGDSLNRDYIVSEVSAGPFGRMVRTERYKYMDYIGLPTQEWRPGTEQLFDMQADPGETRNLAASQEHADTLGDHRRMLAEWEDRIVFAPTLPEERMWPRG
ncbi:MAG TPA: sulfatase-like hydrolase/transferase [Armatimonadota bacterium]|nr:sulfatase-like hydrolase/transferase [Armatimonadota bacterium]